MLAKEQRFIDRFAAHAAKAAQVQSRVKALEKIEKIELPKRRRVVQFDFRTPPRSGEQVAVLEDVTKAYGRRVVHDGLNLTIRRGERWCVMGKNGAGKSTLLKMVAGQLTPDRGHVRLGASLKMGYFAQQSLDLLDPDLTVEEQLRQDFPNESIGALAEPGRRVSVFGRGRRQEDPRAVGRREDAPRARAHAARIRPTSSCSTSRPTTSISRRRRCCSTRSRTSTAPCCSCRTTARSSARLSNRVLELGGESGTEAQPHLYPGSYVEYVERTGHEAPGVHA